MNWMICYDYGKDSKHIFNDMIENKDSAVEALKAYQEKYDDKDIRIIAVVPVDQNDFEDYYNVDDDEKFGKGQDAVKAIRGKIACAVGSYEKIK